MRSALTWAGGIGASVALNGGLAFVLAAAVAPDPPPKVKAPEAEFDIASYPVPEARAVEQSASGTDVPQGETAGARAGGAAVPQSRAAPLGVSGPVAGPIVPDAPARTAVAPESSVLPPVSGGASLPSSDMKLATVAPLRPTPGVAAAAVPSTATLAPSNAAPSRVAPLRPTPGVAAATVPSTATLAPSDVAPGRVMPQRPDGAIAELVAPAAAALAVSSPPSATAAPVAPPVSTAQVVTAPTVSVGAVAALAPLAAPVIPSQAATAPIAAPQGAVASVVPAVIPLKTVPPPAPTTASLAPAQAAVAPLADVAGRMAPTLPPPTAPLSANPVPAPLTTAARVAGPNLAISTPAAVSLGGVQPTSVALRQDVPETPTLGSTEPKTAALIEDQSETVTLGAATPVTAALGEVENADTPVSEDAPQSINIGAAAPRGPETPQSEPPSEIAAALLPPAERQSAALAWSGAGAAALDETSLAAIQAFSRAGDPTGEGPRVRDAISGLLSQVPCARLQTVFDPETGALELRGHIPEDGLRTPVLAALSAQVGSAIPLQDTLLILPRPQCGALAGIEAVGLAQSDEQQGDPRVVGDQPFAAVSRFTDGEKLAFEVQGPDYPAYFYVDYFDANGQVVHLQPNPLVPLRPIAPKEIMPIGLGADGLPAIDIRVSPPFGQEIMVTFASSVPLYDGVRPLVEPAAPYLEYLKAQVDAAKANTPSFKGEWFYFFVETRAGN